MLTIRENFMETIKGGNPDRFVKQYEYQEWINDPLFPIYFGVITPGGEKENCCRRVRCEDHRSKGTHQISGGKKAGDPCSQGSPKAP